MKYSIQETGETISPYKLFRYDDYAGVPNNAELEFWMRIQELEEEVNHWKSNHDNQKTLKSQLMDRPDLKDRAASIQKLQDRINQLELDNESLRRERNNLIVQNEDLEARNKILIETGHWIGQDEAHDLKVAVENFLAEPFFGPQEYRNLREALNACNPHRGSNFDDFLKEDSENRD